MDALLLLIVGLKQTKLLTKRQLFMIHPLLKLVENETTNEIADKIKNATCWWSKFFYGLFKTELEQPVDASAIAFFNFFLYRNCCCCR